MNALLRVARHRRVIARHPWALLAMTFVMGCGGSITATDLSAPGVAEVVVAPLTASVVVGGTLPLQATLRDASGQTISGPSVIWSVQDSSIATVSPAGVVTARAVGSTQVAASADGKSGLASISVTPVPVASISVTPARVDLAPGARAALGAVTYDASGKPLDGRAIVWASSNTGIATVDASGAVTALAAGTAIITATSEGISGTSAVSVAVPSVASVAILPQAATIQRGSTVQLTASVTDESGAAITNRAPTWTSSNTAIAIVSASGLVTAVATGSASVVAALDGKADTTSITVVAVPVGSVTLAPATASLTIGQSATLTATVKDANGAIVTDRPVTWTTSNVAVASVTQAGVVKALAAGTAIISATSDGNSGSATVTVEAGPVATVTLLPSSVTLQRGMTATITATLRDAGGNLLTGRAVAWSSSDTTVARVSTTGVVTAMRIGGAVITATSEGRSATASVAVVPGPVDHVIVTPSSISSLKVGHSVQLSATAVDANGDTISTAAFTWHSSNTLIATVNSSGRVTGVRSGTTTITATFSGKTGNATIRVK
jgi:uncharacterized protein YjdB